MNLKYNFVMRFKASLFVKLSALIDKYIDIISRLSE